MTGWCRLGPYVCNALLRRREGRGRANEHMCIRWRPGQSQRAAAAWLRPGNEIGKFCDAERGNDYNEQVAFNEEGQRGAHDIADGVRPLYRPGVFRDRRCGFNQAWSRGRDPRASHQVNPLPRFCSRITEWVCDPPRAVAWAPWRDQKPQYNAQSLAYINLLGGLV